jgi:glutamine synthetase
MSHDLPEGTGMVAVCIADSIGRLAGKRVPARRWPEIARHGLAMPDFHLVTGIENVPYGDLEVTGYHTGFHNGVLKPLPDTLFRTGLDPDTAFVLSEAVGQDGTLFEEAPRAVLARQVAHLGERGLTARCASELEFYLFRDSYSEAHAADYRGLAPFHHHHGDNDILIAGYAEPFLADLRRTMAEANLTDETTQGEGGPGQYEITLAPTAPLSAADQSVIFKHLTKASAQRAGHAASFMAKLRDDWAGSSGHLHIQVTDEEGRGILGDGEGLSERGAAFLAGLLRFTPELTLLHAPYHNSYRRLRPDSFAPLNCTWAWDNRTSLVRLIGSGEDLRFEFRLPGADSNPYHSLAAVLAAGLEGLAQGLEPPPPVAGNAYEPTDAAAGLPGDLGEAVAAFSTSEVAERALSAPVHRHLIGLAERERDAGRLAVTDWDLRRGFERA